ncbi:MAG: cytochrome c oxidase accessory protein CcoG [Pseudomonadota bacterium]
MADGEHSTAEAPQALYVPRENIQPQLVHGKYRTIKWLMLFVTLGIYYGIPWIRWPRAAQEPDQAVLVDFAGSRLYFFWFEIWPDEFYLVTGILVLSALALFAVTAVWGRLWCGYACPQTVWTDLFIAVERMIEGDRNQRLRLNKSSLSASKVLKKGSKHGIWLLIAMATGGAWIFYFHDAPTIARDFFTGDAPATSYIFVAVLTFTTYSLAGLMREQVCVYMCPWPRIQGAMTDSETFQVGYFRDRGEPRGKRKKGKDWSALGDCVDCKLCVTACPMGIDIRDGDQIDCINCGLCVDACDGVMKKLGFKPGLIAYGSEYATQKADEPRKRFPRLMRPRVGVYAFALLLVSSLMLFGLGSREAVEFGVERDRGLVATSLSDGRVRNALTVRVLNKESNTATYTLDITGPTGLEVTAIGHEVNNGQLRFEVPGDKLIKLRVFATLPQERRNGERIILTLTPLDGGAAIEQSLSFQR